MKKDDRRGLTLIEVLITLALFALLMTLVSSAIVNCLRYYRKGAEMSRLRAKAGMILNVLTSDIAKANAIYNPSSSYPEDDLLYVWVPDIYANEDNLDYGGDLHVYYVFQPNSNGALRRITRYDNTVVTDGIKSIRYTSQGTDTMAVKIELTVAIDVKDPNSMTYTVSTAICRRGTMPMWEFGP
jgi:prepilin-type N-terminal cleavage/methylation domain-containing protein